LPSAERSTGRKASNYRNGIEPLLSILAFSIIGVVFSPLEWWSALQMDPGTPVCGLIFWLGWHWREGESEQWTVFLFVEQFCMGAGLSILFQACLTYTELLDPTPPLAIVAGSFIAGFALAAVHPLLYGRRGNTVLLVGCDGLGPLIASSLETRTLGAVEADASRVPAGVAFLGGFADLAEIVKARRPARIVVTKRNWADWVPPRFLLECKMAGIEIEEAADTYQKLFFRVSVESVRPSQLVWSPTFRANRLAMATQTIYSNLAGLLALVCLSPLLLVIGIVSRLAAGPGPLFDRAQCAGFQGIPFFRIRFRIRDSRTGDPSRIGAAIDRLRLTNLPQLINVVRGEMALFGPRPVRAGLMERLETLIPFYSQKLTVKPGLLGWAQVHGPGSNMPSEESLRLEYDLYYMAQCSPSMDFEILVRTLFGGRQAPERALVR
jgi:lipopolysaccharide/colanic/teichoic acid biosynthesis glycosyltransferase